MPTQRYPAVRFVPQLGAKSSQVEKELEIANQKAHAARWSHARRKQKKKEQEEALRAQSQGLATGAQQDVDPTERYESGEYGHVSTYQPEDSLRLRKHFTTSRTHLSLLEILRDGNSDPFNTQGLPITPIINKLITFIRDAYLPGVYVTSYMKFRDSVPGAPRLTTIGEGFHVFGRRTVTKVWNSMKEELSEEGRALSWCSSYLPVLAKFSAPDTARELNVLAIKMRTKSMKILKGHIEKMSLDTPPDISLISQIVSLFRAACKEGDIAAAKIHAGIIQRLVDRVEVPDRHIQTLFMTCMNNDSELAIAQIRNTFFDYENWIQKQIHRFWAETMEKSVPALPPGYLALHKSITLSATRQAAIRLRQYLVYRSTVVDLNDPEDLNRTDAIYTNFTTYSQYDSGVLINVYINLISGRVYKMEKSSRLIEAALALTTLHVSRRGIMEATVYGCDHRSSHHIILINHLEGTMRQAMDTAAADVLDRYREALLWVCFYGARFEWRVNQKIQGLTPPRIWFSKTFAQQAEILGLTEWPQAREILQQFVFYEFLEPYLPMWFDETMRLHVRRDEEHEQLDVPSYLT
ncbi:hypothetical protein PV04_09934 [Phialophora macrospora]|uniref:Uncharacterized protein n=1 Tax=Phialophora macrospora TaxID=1851006 RepID=A0A0D2CDC5_9EURO|nr:hypothetical protein PV04_09934 [Phialophora macrospora]